jgi:hypothetical protein
MTARTPAATSAHTAQPANQRSSMQKPGIAHRRAQARASELAGAERAKTQPAHTAPQPHSIAWEGGGEAAMKGGAPWFCGRASGCGAEGAPKAFSKYKYVKKAKQSSRAWLLEPPPQRLARLEPPSHDQGALGAAQGTRMPPLTEGVRTKVRSCAGALARSSRSPLARRHICATSRPSGKGVRIKKSEGVMIRWDEARGEPGGE